MNQNEDNKNYGSVFIVSLITLLVSAGFIYLIVNIIIRYKEHKRLNPSLEGER